MSVDISPRVWSTSSTTAGKMYPISFWSSLNRRMISLFQVLPLDRLHVRVQAVWLTVAASWLQKGRNGICIQRCTCHWGEEAETNNKTDEEVLRVTANGAELEERGNDGSLNEFMYN